MYYTYACKNCKLETGEANILKTPKEPALLSGNYASAEAVAHIAVQKFAMYSPLYWLEQEFGRQGLKLSRQTKSNWLLHVSEMWLQPIYNALTGGWVLAHARRKFDEALQTLPKEQQKGPPEAIGE